MKTAKQTAPRFPNRVRFNWGYHDAASDVRNGRAIRMDGNTAETIVANHFDQAYAIGYTFGHRDALAGTYKEWSAAAWAEATAANLVQGEAE